mmetsp:Transcript_30728/g.69719  ORF Transcript_30728/g.69719 Transcript_30728/m.69719 type:complete len:352 (+) Transcript_30728:91-1146(+)
MCSVSIREHLHLQSYPVNASDEYVKEPVAYLDPPIGGFIAVETKSNLGESPIWDADRSCLFWIDISQLYFFRLSWTTSELERWNWAKMFPYGRPGCIVPCMSGRILVAFETGFGFYNPDNCTMEFVGTGAAWMQDDLISAGYGVRLNDGRVDPFGRLVVGGLAYDYGTEAWKDVHPIYVVEKGAEGSNHSVSTRILEHVPTAAISNSICFNPQGTIMYHCDTPTKEIVAYKYDAARGVVTGRKTAAIKTAFCPDGSVCDTEGGIWNAQCDGGRCVRYVLSNGSWVEDMCVDLPCKQVTCPAIGGPHSDLLFLATGRPQDEELRKQEPLAGALFIYKLPRCYEVVNTKFNDI